MTSTSPMGVDQFGVDPVRLRKFLRDMTAYYRQDFTTPDAMESLELGEPEGTRALLAMAEAKWLIYLGQDDGIDRWKVGRLGIQYSLKNFLKRMPVEKAEALLERTIAGIREFNGSNASTRISQVTLFGSLAKGGDEHKTVGDIDLQVTIKPRGDISKQQRKALLAAEMEHAPKGATMEFQNRFWAEQAGVRHLRAISPRLTVSTHDNIADMGCEHMVVYRLDPETGDELPCDRTLVPADDDKQAEFNADAEHEAPLPAVPELRPWPEVPRRMPTGLYARNKVDRSVAQYLWQRGYSLEEIARRQSAQRIDLQAVLAQCGTSLPDPASIVMADSPVDAVAPLLANFLDVHANIRLGNFGSSGTANVHLRRGRHHAMCTASANRAEIEGDPELGPLAEVVARGAALWHKRFRSKTSKIELTMEFDLKGYSLAVVPEPSTMKSATAFGKTFNQSFDELYSKAEFEPLYHDRRIRSFRLYLDLLSFELYQTERRGTKDMLPLGRLGHPAEDLLKALVGGHSNVISSIL